MSFRLFLCRHANTPFVDSRVQEPRDPELQPGASVAGAAIAEMVAGLPMSFVATSPRRRCVQTAELARLRAPMRCAAFGPIEGSAHESFVKILRGAESVAIEDERLRHFSAARQFMPALQELDRYVEALAASVKGNALVVTHAEIIAYAVARWVGIESSRLGPVRPGSLSIIEFGPQPRLLAYNAMSPSQLFLA